MYQFLADRTAARIARHTGVERGSEQFASLRYGSYVLYLNLFKTVLLLLIALVLGLFRYIAVFALAYSLLRLYSFGVHLARPITCTLLGLVYYLGSAFVSLYATPPLWVRVALLTGCALLFARYAPAATKRRPISQRMRPVFRRRSLAMLALVAVAAVLLSPYPVYSSQLVLAAVCQTVNLLPVTYKILGKEVVCS